MLSSEIEFLGETLIIDLFRGCLVIKESHTTTKLVDGEPD